MLYYTNKAHQPLQVIFDNFTQFDTTFTELEKNYQMIHKFKISE